MRASSISLGLAAALTLATVATPCAGGVISTGMVLFRPNALVCTVANVSGKPVKVDAVTVIDEDGASLTLLTDKSTCTFPGAISPALACRQVFAGSSSTTLFGRCVVQAHGGRSALRVRILTAGSAGDVETSEGR